MRDLWYPMQVLSSFYGSAITLAVIACGLAWIVSADIGREIAKRCGVLILLFSLGNVFWPPAGVDFFEATMRILPAIGALVGALVWLIDPRSAAELLRWFGALGLGLFLLIFA